jgi:cell division protein YceG involved in septum cleavage
MRSAVNPEESDYWFYMHSPDGTIHYAKTAEEHAINVQKYLGKK